MCHNREQASSRVCLRLMTPADSVLACLRLFIQAREPAALLLSLSRILLLSEGGHAQCLHSHPRLRCNKMRRREAGTDSTIHFKERLVTSPPD